MQNVLRDSSLSQYHSAVIEAIVTIFKTLGLKCVPFLPQIVPTFISIIRTAPQTRLESYFNQLAILVSIVRQHIRPYVTDLVNLVNDFWTVTPQVQATVLSLVDALSRSLEGEFKVHIINILPLMMRVLENDSTPRKAATEKVLHSILVFGQAAEEHMWLILPKLVRTFQKHSNPVATRKACIDTIGKISRQVNISDYAGLLVHNLTDVLGAKEQNLRTAALDCICALIFQIGQDFEPYINGVKKVCRSYMLQGNIINRCIRRPSYQTMYLIITTMSSSLSFETASHFLRILVQMTIMPVWEMIRLTAILVRGSFPSIKCI